MQSADDIRRDLPPDLERSESEPLVALALRLDAATPPPAPTFRGDLRRRLLGTQRSRTGPLARRQARRLALSYAGSGLLLLAVATIGLAGAGPFAAG